MGFLFKLSLIIFILAVLTFGFSYYLKHYTNYNLNETRVLNNTYSTTSEEINNNQIPRPEISTQNLFNQNEVKVLTPVDERKRSTNNQSLLENINESTATLTEDLEPIEITINAKEFSFEPNIFKVKENQPVKLIIKNVGNIPHNLKIEKENIIFQTSLIAPGEEAILEFKAPLKGEYDFYCTLSDNKMRGMFGKMIVE